MDHRTADITGLTSPLLFFFLTKRKKGKNQKNLVVAEISTQQHRKYPPKVYSAGRTANAEQVPRR